MTFPDLSFITNEGQAKAETYSLNFMDRTGVTTNQESNLAVFLIYILSPHKAVIIRQGN